MFCLNSDIDLRLPFLQGMFSQGTQMAPTPEQATPAAAAGLYTQKWSLKDCEPTKTEDGWENVWWQNQISYLLFCILNCEEFNTGYKLCSREQLEQMLITS